MPVQAAPLTTKAQRIQTAVVLTCLAGFTVALFFYAPLVAGGYLAFIVLAVFGLTVRNRRQGRAFVRENNAALAALARGELEKAHDVFRSWAEGIKLPRAAALARHNLASTLTRMGKLDESLAVHVDNDTRNPGALRALGLYATSAISIAFMNALLGNLPEAETWIATADQRHPETVHPSLPPVRAFTLAIVDCRSGRFADAARMLADHWPEYEGTAPGGVIRPLRVVRAFAIAQVGPREAGNAEALLAGSRPAYPREYEFLGTHWPEMASFLAAHGLAPDARTTPA